jgi:hypothetical protein
VVALGFASLIRSPIQREGSKRNKGKAPAHSGKKKRLSRAEEEERRGRSRASKDLFGYGVHDQNDGEQTQAQASSWEAGTSSL